MPLQAFGRYLFKTFELLPRRRQPQAARAAAAQRGAASALNDLRSLPAAGDALQSRADAAAAEAAARRQRKAVDDLVWRLAKKGF